jgi:aspartyl protease family protein
MRFVFVVLGLFVLLGILWHQFPYALNNEWQRADALYALILLIVLSMGIFHRSEVPWRAHAAHMLAWVAIIIIIMIGYSFREDIKSTRFFGELFPQQTRVNDAGEVVLYAREDGHFYIEAKVNTIPVLFMVDTGATGISLRYEDAVRANMDVEQLNYNLAHSTANGISFKAGGNIAQLTLAGLRFENLPVSISKEGRQDISLLGLRFLQQFKSYTFEGDKLTLIP